MNNFEIHQKEITTINLHAPNFLKHILMNLTAHIDTNTVVVGYFVAPLSSIVMLSKQKINKEILEVNDTIDQNGPN
jgi:hypothetical protein